MPSKPELETRDDLLGGYIRSEIIFRDITDRDLFDTWLSEHGWKAFQDYYELQEVKNEIHPPTSH